MKMSEQTKELFEALAGAAADARLVETTGQNTYDKYKYGKLDDYVLAVRPIFKAHGLALVSSVEHVESLPAREVGAEGKRKSENVARVRLDVLITHVTGQWVQVSSWGEGQDRADKAVYKAITGARKYGIAAALNLATGDDPEAYQDVGGNDGGSRPDAKPQAAPQNGNGNGKASSFKTPVAMSKDDELDALQRLKAACEKAEISEDDRVVLYGLYMEKRPDLFESDKPAWFEALIGAVAKNPATVKEYIAATKKVKAAA